MRPPPHCLAHRGVYLTRHAQESLTHPEPRAPSAVDDVAPTVSVVRGHRPKLRRVKNLKTGKSRTVDRSARAAAVLSDLRALAETEALAARKDAAPEWIFVTRAGAPPRPHHLAKTFLRVARGDVLVLAAQAEHAGRQLLAADGATRAVAATARSGCSALLLLHAFSLRSFHWSS